MNEELRSIEREIEAHEREEEEERQDEINMGVDTQYRCYGCNVLQDYHGYCQCCKLEVNNK